ncbi:RHS repeat-associated core domain-containing protein [Kangiella sp. HZ709]|uniref:RHS repeat-associated core domain-containing protein n=1 Tax=Kangiella sp. HZ709 TaxID=2666328 RepID=UPI0012B0F904|nr:RHS repeat-associated core domain-containing protein [Kangiella sp. HZ709]MRX27296.1 hypothetical protein [Kangiella sp. HZ709]
MLNSKRIIYSMTLLLVSLTQFTHAFPGGGGIPSQPQPWPISSVTVPSSSSTGNYTVSWTTSNHAANYQWREEVNGVWSPSWNTVIGTSVSISGRSTGTYRYQVKGCHALASPQCSDATTSGSIAVSVVLIPGTPSSISISDDSSSADGAYTVSWGASSNSPTSYQYRESTNGTWGSWVGNGTSRIKSITGKANGTYAYQARGCNSAGCGSAKTSSNVVVNIPVVPGPPSSITISDGSSSTDGAYTVSWGASSNSPASYQYREATNGTWGAWISNGASRTKSISGKINGTYAYQARGCNSAGCGSAKGSSNVVVSIPQGNINWQNTGGTVPDAAWSGDTPVLSGNTNVGALEGSGGVSGGAATYNIPIVIPPGRAGMQPSVSLGYSSRSSNGVAGVGWSLSGGSSIHRCGATFAQDGYSRGVNYSASDKLCLDGQRLIRTSGTYGVSGAVYRTELDNFAKVVQSGNINSSSNFTVYHKDGRISKYGLSSNSQHKAGGKSQILTWAIAEVQDPSKNTITYDYNNYGNGEHLLTAIHYTGSNGSDGDRHVRMIYDNRPDVSRSYLAGGLTQSSKRLLKVQTQYQSSYIREYRLRYAASGTSQRSLIQGVTECGLTGGTYCLPETTFDWYDDSVTHSSENIPTYLGDFEPYDDLDAADLNGDGIPEFIKLKRSILSYLFGLPAYSTVIVKDESGNAQNTIQINNPYVYEGQTVDLDLNGKSERAKLKWQKISDANYKTFLATGITYDWIDGSQIKGVEVAFPSAITVTKHPTSPRPEATFSDVNNDGFQDVLVETVQGSQRKLALYLHNGNATSPNFNYWGIVTNLDTGSFFAGAYEPTVWERYSIQDINGDGISDIVLSLRTELSKAEVNKYVLGSISNSGVLSFGPKQSASNFGLPANTFYNYFTWADINGDGLQDYVSVEGTSSPYWAVRINKGNGTFDAVKSLGTAVGTHYWDGYAVVKTWNHTDLTAKPLTYQSQYSKAQPYFGGAIVADYDADGKDEILVPTEAIDGFCYTHVIPDVSEAPICNDNLHRTINKVSADPKVRADKGFYATKDVRRFKWSVLKFDQNSNGSFSSTVTPDVVNAPLNTAEHASFKVKDVNGDGLVDFVIKMAKGYCIDNRNKNWCGGLSDDFTVGAFSPVPPNAGKLVIKYNTTSKTTANTYSAVDSIQSITNGLDNTVKWQYSPIAHNAGRSASDLQLYKVPTADNQRYVGGQPNSKYFYFGSSMHVVSAMDKSDGIGGFNKTQYGYREAVYNRQGRGFQGFRSVIVDDLSDVDSNKHIRSVSDFHQKFPLAGKLEQTRTCLVSSGSEACNSGLINKAYYKWDLWRDGVKKQTVDNAAEDFSAQVFDGQTSVNRYWVSPYNQFSYDYLTKSGHNQAMTVSDWINHTYQNFVFDTNGCQTYERKFSHEPGNVNRSEAVSNNYYHTPNTSSWWLCKPNYSLTTTKAVSGRATDYAAIQSGTDFQKQVKTTYVFDNSHRKPKQITTIATQGQGTAAGLDSVVHTAYNSHGLPISVISDGEHYTGADMADRNVSTTYTADGYFVNSVTNSKGHVTATEVDPIHGQATKVIDPNGQVTTMTYDAFGRVRSTKLPGEPTQWVAYDWCSGVNGGSAWCFSFPEKKYRVYTIKNGTPRNLKYFDGFNRENYSITRNFEDDHWYYTWNKFNNKGQKTHEATLNGGVTTWQYTYFNSYDALGRLTKKQTPQSDGGHLPTTYQYDGFVTNINAGGLLMARKYNGLGQLVWTKDAHNNYTRYAYDGTGNPITLQDANGNPIYAKYNALGQKEYVDDPNMGKKFFWYNTFGEVEKEKDANLTELTYSYDTLGRMTQRWTNGTRSGYWYWDNGNVANYQGLLRWSYDGPSTANARVKYHYYGKTTGGKLYETQTKYRHNESGSFTDYDIIHYVDNNFGRPKGMKYNTTGLTLAYDYNPQGYMSRVKNANGGYVYQEIKDLDNHGKVTSQWMGHGVMTQTASYDPATAQMTMIKSQKTSGATRLHELTYSYDDFSNLNMQVMIASNGVSNSEDYQYDSLHRLIQSDRTLNTTGQYNTITYNYDAVGNFTKKSDYANTYTYGVLGKDVRKAGPNAVSRIVRPNNLGSMTYYYDNNGNLKNQLVYNASGVRQTAQEKIITYNEFNKPLTIKKGNITSGFSYGVDLMRYKQVKTGAAGGTITTYYIDKLLEKEVQGSTTKYKHYIGDVAIQTKKNSTWEIGFTHRDRLGSVVTITDHMGNLKEHRSFDPFGKPRKGDFVEPSQNTFTSITGLTQMNRTTERGFTDHEHLDDHELIHMNGRAYDYNLGRFLSVDPVIQAPGNSQSMNPYSYIMNNPLAGTDPTGYTANCGGTVMECGTGGPEQPEKPDPEDDNGKGEKEKKKVTIEELLKRAQKGEKIIIKGKDGSETTIEKNKRGYIDVTKDGRTRSYTYVSGGTSKKGGCGRANRSGCNYSSKQKDAGGMPVGSGASPEFLVDITPIVGDIKAIYDAANDPSAVNIGGAVLGILPFVGDAASAGLKGTKGLENLRGAAKRLGVDLGSVKIIDGVAHIKINLTDSLNPNDLLAMKDALRASGAKSIQVQTGFIANTGLDRVLFKKASAGRTFVGGKVRLSDVKGSDYILDYDL